MSAITSQVVLDHYSALAREDTVRNAKHIKKIAESFGYAPEDLAAIPEGANLGVSCGNPLAIARLKAGETVIDLGCGAGFDVFQAARKIGPTGLSIGVDMSPDMLSLAQKNASKASITNVKFVLAPITKIPLPSETVDCIISNCVINLLGEDEKLICFREVFRLLKEGGRLAVSDILAKKRFTEELRRDIGLFVGCISGASLVGEYEGWLREAGFEDIMIVDKKSDLNVYKERNQGGGEGSSCCGTSKEKEPESSCCAPSTACCSTEKAALNEEELAETASNIDFNEWVSSFNIYAVKPVPSTQG